MNTATTTALQVVGYNDNGSPIVATVRCGNYDEVCRNYCAEGATFCYECEE